MDEKQKEAVKTMTEFIETLAKAGFESEEDIVTSALEYMEGEAEPSFLLPLAKKITHSAFARLEAEQASWPSVTDCDRLDAAFEELDESGIISRQNFWCCQTCGNEAIGYEMQQAYDNSRDVRGYAFYHSQDTENAAIGGGVFLCYGSVEESDDDRIALANEIVSTIEKHGLHPVWNGDLNRRIEVPLDWKRRRSFPNAPRSLG